MGSIDKRDSTPQLLNRLRMRQIALMLAIEERQTLRAAATQLGLSQPAATKMLHELEDALGQPLFERVGRQLRRNAAGDRVFDYFRAMRGSMEALNRELGELRQGSAGRLVVGSIMAASPGRLTRALLDLKQQLPLLEIEVAVDTSDRLLAQLHEGVLEVVVGRLAAASARFGAPIARLGFPMAPREAALVASAVGALTARQMLLEAATFSAAEMAARGFVGSVVDDDQLQAAALASAQRVAALAPQAARHNKQILRALLAAPLAAAQALAGQGVQGRPGDDVYAYADGPEHREGIAAFLEKRTPAF